jgi:hypothetical protein
MVDFNDDTDGGEESDKTPRQGYEPHPLFPREDFGRESRDIQFISFCRRRSDGVIDFSPEDIPAGEITSWLQVVGPWGGGEYKAIGKNKNHRIVAWSPEKHAEWLLFDTEPRPFTVRDQRDLRSAPTAAPPAPLAPPALTLLEYTLNLLWESQPRPVGAIPPRTALIVELVKSHVARLLLGEQGDCPSRPAAAPPAPLAPPALTSIECALRDLIRELRASPASSLPSMEAVLVTMIKSQRELLRTMLSAVRPQGTGKTDPQPTDLETTVAELLFHALRGTSPKQ